MSNRIFMVGDVAAMGLGPSAFGLGGDRNAIYLENRIRSIWKQSLLHSDTAGDAQSNDAFFSDEFLQFRTDYMANCHLQYDSNGHVGFYVCDSCGTKPIHGTRYMCEMCNYDLCSDCVQKVSHSHPLNQVAPSVEKQRDEIVHRAEQSKHDEKETALLIATEKTFGNEEEDSSETDSNSSEADLDNVDDDVDANQWCTLQ